ncbi:hypothetical protein ACWDYJ_07105 [Streptomyces sp. NPDC003042]
MSEDDRPTPDPHAASVGAQVQASARGWHTVQLAVFGFIGICGVLKSGSGGAAPRGIEELAGVLILVALAVACWATYLVARVAWPLPVPAAAGPEGAKGVERAARRLRRGLALTFLAVVLVSTAAASSWWPTPPASQGQLVEVSTSAGTLCGTLGTGDEGNIRLRTQGQTIDIPLGRIARLSPASTCP